MAVEEAFAVELPNDDVERIITVGDMHRVVLDLLRRKGTPENPDDVLEHLVRIIVETAGVEPDQVVPEARFVDDLGID